MSTESYREDKSRLPADCCEHLCTKSLYMARQDDDRPYEAEAEVGTASFWCLHTQMPKGLDGGEVTPDQCRPPRDCCLPRFTV